MQCVGVEGLRVCPSVLTLPLTSIMTLDKSFHLSESQISICKTNKQKMIHGLHLIGFMWRFFFKKILLKKVLEQCENVGQSN